MQNVRSFLFVLSTLILGIATTNAQVISDTGSIKQEIDTIIQYLPSPDGNQYAPPTNAQLDDWDEMLDSLFSGNYTNSATTANTLGYDLIAFTDTITATFTTYYILKTMGVNYWGTYVYNPNYCRPVIIQSPHPKKDANTGKQGLHVFKESEALFFCLAGTHRCNSTLYSTCSGTTTGCSTTSANYRISDMAHNINSVFQKTTENLSINYGNTYFIQLHGFTKLSTDPYVIMSNGTQVASCPDFLPTFATKLHDEDNTLTFKIGHIDLSWTRLRGFWNTQCREVNGVLNPCNVTSYLTNGRFFHMEQEKIKLRNNVTGWNKVANAVVNTFPCTSLTDTTAVLLGYATKDYHTTCAPFTWVNGNTYNFSTNNATHLLTAVSGCDSLVTLKLTINNNTGIDTQTACNSFLWIDGNTYTSSDSTATHTLTNTAGCDSVVTLNLTINSSSSITDTQIACDSFTWMDGITYTSSNNTATHVLSNTAGCDSVITLNLTINSVDTSVTQTGNILTSNAVGANYHWVICPNMSLLNNATNANYTPNFNGSYAVIVSQNGCIDTSACITISDLHIIENDFGSQLKVFPNPTDGEIHMDLGDVYTEVKVSLYDSKGKLLGVKIEFNTSLLEFNIDRAKGQYLIKIEATSGEKAVIRVYKR